MPPMSDLAHRTEPGHGFKAPVISRSKRACSCEVVYRMRVKSEPLGFIVVRSVLAFVKAEVAGRSLRER